MVYIGLPLHEIVYTDQISRKYKKSDFFRKFPKSFSRGCRNFWNHPEHENGILKKLTVFDLLSKQDARKSGNFKEFP